MATRGDFGFIENNEKWFMYSHYDNYPNNVLPNLVQFLGDYGYEEYVSQIKEFGSLGGMRGINAQPDEELGEWYKDRKVEKGDTWKDGLYNESDNSYGYLVHPDTTIEMFNYGHSLGVITGQDIIRHAFGENVFKEYQ